MRFMSTLLILLLHLAVPLLAFKVAPHQATYYEHSFRKRRILSAAHSFDSLPAQRNFPRALWHSLLPLSVTQYPLKIESIEGITESKNATGRASARGSPMKEIFLGAVVVLDYTPRLIAAEMLGRILSRPAIRIISLRRGDISGEGPLVLTIISIFCSIDRAIEVSAPKFRTAARLLLSMPMVRTLVIRTLWIESIMKKECKRFTRLVIGAASTVSKNTMESCIFEVAIAPITEEIAHRGILQGTITLYGNVIHRILRSLMTHREANQTQEKALMQCSEGRYGHLPVVAVAIAVVFATKFVRVLSATWFASLHSIDPVPFEAFRLVLPPAANLAAEAALKDSPSFHVFRSPYTAVLAQKRLGTFLMSLLVFAPLAQRGGFTQPTETPKEYDLAYLELRRRRRQWWSRLPLAAIGAHITWNLLCWSPHFKLFYMIGMRHLLTGRTIEPSRPSLPSASVGRVGAGDWLGTVIVFEGMAWLLRSIAVKVTKHFRLPLSLAPQPQHAKKTDSSAATSRDDDENEPTFFMPYKLPWLRCEPALSKPLLFLIFGFFLSEFLPLGGL